MTDNTILNQGTELRPYEKCVKDGVTSLSDAELLAVIIKTGTNGMNATELARDVLGFSRNGTSNGVLELMNLSITELMRIKGIGKVKAIQVQCICELSRRIAKATAYMRLDFHSPETIAQYYMEDMRHREREALIVAMLDSKCRLIQDTILSIGTVNASLITPREVFIEALRYNAVGIVILHNHPSGDCTPSKNDVEVTLRLRESGELLGIHLIDHIIIGNNNYTSFKEKMIL